jgi:G:T-mismatch repair DNA endonuclease (very short patch repair protein)
MKCKICGFEGKSLVSHLKKHNISGSEYKKKYNVDKIHSVGENQKKYLSDLWKNRMKDKKWKKKYNKHKKSIWSYEYWMNQGMTETDAKEKVKKIQSNNSKKRNFEKSPSVLSKQFYINKGYTVQEAEQIISKIQSKNSKKSSKFLGKKHTDESRKKISNSMSEHVYNVGIDTWLSHFGDLSDIKYRSNAEVELYKFISKITDNNAKANVFLEAYNVDILYKNKIIDYFGIYWHCHPDFYKDDYYHPHKNKYAIDIRSEDNKRINNLKQMGYDVMIVWENEYIKNKADIKNKVKKFIHGS